MATGVRHNQCVQWRMPDSSPALPRSEPQRFTVPIPLDGASGPPGEPELLAVVRDVFGASPIPSVDHRLRLLHGVADFDDCAVVEMGDSGYLVVGSDFIRGDEFYLFELGVLSYWDLGYFLVVANVSDIAAMGAQPAFLTTNIRYPSDLTRDAFRSICEGIQAAATVADTAVIGGDIGGFSRLVLTATAIGTTTVKPLMRASAQPGDVLYYAGPMGVAGSAVLYFRTRESLSAKLSDADERTLANAWRRPKAQVEVGLSLADSGVRAACQDNSDGVRATVEQLCRASGVGADIHESSFAPDPLVERVASLSSVAPYALALTGSVDFGLLFTLPSSVSPEDVMPNASTVLRLGECTPDSLQFRFVRRDGSIESELPGIRWEQQWASIYDSLEVTE